MKTIDVNTGTHTVEELIRVADGDNTILRTRDGREFVLAEVDDFDREVELVRQDEELMRFLESRSKSGGRHTSDEVRKGLGLT